MNDLNQPMSVESQSQVITDHFPELVRGLSANAAAYNLILDELLPNDGMPRTTHGDMRIKDKGKENETANVVRDFLFWLMKTPDPQVFKTFYAALSKHGLKSVLNILQRHTLFPEACKIPVSTCHSVSIPYTCT